MKQAIFQKLSRLFFLSCIQIVGSFVTAQNNVNDGPYVFYKADSVIVCSLFDGTVKRESFPVSQKSQHSISIQFSDHPDWNFSVPLKSKIEIEPSAFPSSSKLIAFSDIEGEFEPFRDMLLKNGVIDRKYNWTFGNGTLVIAGDLFDRGKEVAAYLWLLYKLEDEARAVGGYVRVVLGNHEIMNLSGDIRYVDGKYIYSAQLLGGRCTDLYTSNTELGRWLRSKNIIEKIGDLLVLHGGVSSELNQLNLSVQSINGMARPYYDQSKQITSFANDTLSTLFSGETSPFWYRGYFIGTKASTEQVDSTLKFYHCSHIIVGHDIIEHVTPLYSNKIIGIDVDEHAGNAEGLYIEAGKYYRIDRSGKKMLLF